MADYKQIEIRIRRSLTKKFPETIYHVSCSGNKVSIRAIGGRLRYEEFTNDQLRDMVVEAIREVLPYFEMTDYESMGHYDSVG